MSYQPPPAGGWNDPYAQPNPGYGPGYPTDPEQGSRTTLIVLSLVGALLLIAIIGVGGWTLLKDDDSSSNDKASSEEKTEEPTQSPQKTEDDEPTESPTDTYDDDIVGTSNTPYKFDVPPNFKEDDPPSSTYVDDNAPTYEHAAFPNGINNGFDAIIVSAWSGQQNESTYDDDELTDLMDQVANNLSHTEPGTNLTVDGQRARQYVKSDAINTFVLVDTYFIQIRCQFHEFPSEIQEGCDNVLDTIEFN